MANLRRHIAPIDSEAWQFIDEEAVRVLNSKLTARKAVEFVGPKGMDFAAVNTGRKVEMDDAPIKGVSYSKRHVLPLVETRVPFRLKIDELESLARGAEDVDTDSLVDAAEKIAKAENGAIYNGLESAGIKGILSVAEQKPIKVEDDIVAPTAQGVEKLVAEGIEGPYNLVLGRELYTLLFKPNDKGYPAKNRLDNLLGGNVISAPGLERKGLLLTVNSEDFEFIVGQDISVGFSKQVGEELEFFMIESFTFRVNAPEAAIILE